MSVDDEIRYGRACSLVLNKSVNVLRRVVEHSYTTQGAPSFEVFLNNNKHVLFHLLFKHCCCGNNSTEMPLYKYQWQLLYVRTSTRNPHGRRGECPCKYAAISGVTPDIMDVSLCCLVLHNICSSVSMPDIDTIRDVRNQLIHASNASLDTTLYSDTWNKVEAAMLNLAQGVSSSFRSDTLNAAQALEDRLMDSSELSALKALVMDEKRISEDEERISECEKRISECKKKISEDERRISEGEKGIFEDEKKISECEKKISECEKRISDYEKRIYEYIKRISDCKMRISDCEKRIFEAEKRISEVEKRQDITQDELTQHKTLTNERICHVESEIETLQADQAALMSGISKQKDFPEEKIDELKKKLVESYQKATQKIQVSPLQKRAKKLPLDTIFAPVMIRQDLEDKTTEPDLEDKATMSNQDDSKPNVKTQQVRNPKDMFYKDGKPVRHIFMQGEAAHGKTVYCKRLLQYWCASKQAGAQKECLFEWEESLNEFDFVFFFMFRLVNKTTSSIVDMILDEVSQHSPECADAIRHVLSNKEYRCLIIMDGLDEWKISQNQRGNLRHKRFPNFGGLSGSCSLFITFRPWVYDALVDLVEDADRVVEICGLDENGITLVIEKMLINFYNMDEMSEEYKETRKKMIMKSKDEHLKSIMEIPLLITASVMLWVEKEHVGGAYTSFYISLVQLLIKRALDTDAMDEDLIGRVEKKSTSGLQMPIILQKAKNKTVRRFIGVLNSLGKLAYDDLLSDETNLVFGKEELEDKIDEDDKEFALRVGLLSQCEAPGCFDQENVTVNFFHKTVQEFLAAIHVLCNKSVIFNELCSHLRSIDILFDLSNVVVFLSGLSPSVGDELSQHVANLSNTDTEICRYREEFLGSYSLKVWILFRFQIRCYQEMKSEGSLLPDAHEFIKFHGKDICLPMSSDSDSWLHTSEILEHHPCILTLNLHRSMLYGFGGNRINMSLSDFLANSETLHSIRLLGFSDTKLSPTCSSNNTLSNFGRHLPLKYLCLSFVLLPEDICCGIINSVKSSLQLKKLELFNFDVIRSIETDRASGMSVYARLQGLLPFNLKTRNINASGLSDNAWLQDLLHVLPDCMNLTTISIDFNTIQTEENIVVLMTVLPKLKNLHEFSYNGAYRNFWWSPHHLDSLICNLIFANSLKNSSQLRKLKVGGVKLYDLDRQTLSPLEIVVDSRLNYDQPSICFLDSNNISIELTSAWTNLEKFDLYKVSMSPWGWYKFLISLLEIRHSFDVELFDTNINEETVNMVRSCPFFSMKTFTRHHSLKRVTVVTIKRLTNQEDKVSLKK